MEWEAPVEISRVVMSFDTDFDHAMESVQRGHPERAMPFCVRAWRLTDSSGAVVAEARDNHRTRNEARLARPVRTARLSLEVLEMNGPAPAAVFEVRAYS
jgi:hypothetical protein